MSGIMRKGIKGLVGSTILMMLARRAFEEYEALRESSPWGPSRVLGSWRPDLDLEETSEAFIVRADLAGIEPDDIDLKIKGNTLILQGKRKSFNELLEDQRRLNSELDFGDFYRELTPPEEILPDKIEASLNSGILEVVMPKAEAGKVSKVIKVERVDQIKHTR